MGWRHCWSRNSISAYVLKKWPCTWSNDSQRPFRNLEKKARTTWKPMPLTSSLVSSRSRPISKVWGQKRVSVRTVERWGTWGVSVLNRHRLGTLRKTPTLPRRRRTRLDSDYKPSRGGQVTRAVWTIITAVEITVTDSTTTESRAKMFPLWPNWTFSKGLFRQTEGRRSGSSSTGNRITVLYMWQIWAQC